MIEIKNARGNGFELWLDGVNVKDGFSAFVDTRISKNEKIFALHTYNEEASHKIAGHRLSEVPTELAEIGLYRIFHLFNQGDADTVVVIRNDMKSSGQFELYLNSYFITDTWKHPWSIAEYKEELSRTLESKSSSGVQLVTDDESHLYGDTIRLQLPAITDTSLTIVEAVNSHANLLARLHELTEASLTAKLRSDSVIMHFDFPEEVKVPCEQYLLYFAQFLRDLGVKADTALTHEAGQVLFTVTPEDKDQALDKIRAALDAYLHLPSNPIADAANESIAIHRLESNILRLRSDLKLAAAELQAKETTIEAQRLMLDVQKGLLSGEIVANSMKNVTPAPKDKDKEEFLGGTVSLIPLKGKGVEINLPELFRRLKRLFAEEE